MPRPDDLIEQHERRALELIDSALQAIATSSSGDVYLEQREDLREVAALELAAAQVYATLATVPREVILATGAHRARGIYGPVSS